MNASETGAAILAAADGNSEAIIKALKGLGYQTVEVRYHVTSRDAEVPPEKAFRVGTQITAYYD